MKNIIYIMKHANKGKTLVFSIIITMIIFALITPTYVAIWNGNIMTYKFDWNARTYKEYIKPNIAPIRHVQCRMEEDLSLAYRFNIIKPLNNHKLTGNIRACEDIIGEYSCSWYNPLKTVFISILYHDYCNKTNKWGNNYLENDLFPGENRQPDMMDRFRTLSRFKYHGNEKEIQPDLNDGHH